ncbi:MAG: hypothetical protein V1721_05630 [Pseudomonadota bacterium]
METGKPADLGNEAEVVTLENSALYKVVNTALGFEAIMKVVELIKPDAGIRIGQLLEKAVGKDPDIVMKNPDSALSRMLPLLFVPGTEVSKIKNDVPKSAPPVRTGTKLTAS